ncbi:hypothetical protein PGTUg99_019245 [Puccinia graminis f. sp. tritici]|uniref:Uncharacterized protein n=1 Tax=Puccinia graminis f. sp. tritici TaxID=56615 RepID=A0A5B0REB3_PUCGR|nr:hypothetical protein PGTUg99_019245 [Puccinia graminis f. sp. tritici]
MRLTLEEALQLKEARDKKIRDDWIRVMEMRINQEKLAECYRTEGVNSYEQCAHLAQTVISQIPEGRASLSSSNHFSRRCPFRNSSLFFCLSFYLR